MGIKQLGVPDSVTEVVFARVIEERQAEIRRLTAEGESQAASIIGRAEGKAIEMKSRAEAKAKEIEGQGDAEAAEYYASFLDHPSLADFLRKLDTLRITLSEQTTIVIDADSPPFDMIITGPNVGADADRKWLGGGEKPASEKTNE